MHSKEQTDHRPERRGLPGWLLNQGPIVNLFQTELAAQQIPDDEFTEDELLNR